MFLAPACEVVHVFGTFVIVHVNHSRQLQSVQARRLSSFSMLLVLSWRKSNKRADIDGPSVGIPTLTAVLWANAECGHTAKPAVAEAYP